MSEPSSPEVVIPLEVTVDVKEPEKKILSLAQKLILLQEIVPDVKSTKDETSIRETSQRLKTLASSNFQIEKQIQEMDKKIKDTRVEAHRQREGRDKKEKINTPKGGKQNHKSQEEKKMFADRREHYQSLFFLLHANPRYLASLARAVAMAKSHTLVQTIVMDVYGDQYSPREERLLLTLFREVIRHEVAHSTSGSFMRSNTCLTQMLTAYARRGAGMSILKEVFTEPITAMLDAKHSFEVIPMKVYQDIISRQEQATGKPSDLDKKATPEQAAVHPEVIAEIAARAALLIAFCNDILSRILAAAERIPFGMRWICKQLHTLATDAFSEATKDQLDSLVGGYLFLRFFNPVLVAPDSIALCAQPSKKARRNLILACTVLQKLSNGVCFGEREKHMMVMNSMIEENKGRVREYFATIIDVSGERIDHPAEMDQYLEHTSERHLLLNVNQVYLIHELCALHLDAMCAASSVPVSPTASAPSSPISPRSDPLRTIISHLGTDAPAQLSRSLDRQVTLQLVCRDEELMDPQGSMVVSPQAPTLPQIKALLVEVLPLLTIDPSASSLSALLDTQAAVAEQRELGEHKEKIERLVGFLQSLVELRTYPGESQAEVVGCFLDDVLEEYQNRESLAEKLDKKLVLITETVAAVQAHHDFLSGRLDGYREVYDDLLMKTVLGKAPNVRANNKYDQAIVKSQHKDLVDMNVIRRIIPALFQQQLDSGVKVKYKFTQESKLGSIITVSVKAKKRGFTIPVNLPVITLDVAELMESDEHKLLLPVDDPFVEMNRNILLHYLHTSFKFKGL